MVNLCKMATGHSAGILKLSKDDGGQPLLRVYLLDAECDPFWIDYDMDGTATVYTDGNKYLLLDSETMDMMLSLSDKAMDQWEELDPFYNEKTNAYEGWERMITPDESCHD